MKKISKKITSIILSLVLVTSMLPLSGLTVFAKTDWTLISSTDFKGTTWAYTSNSGSYNYTDATGFKSIDGSTSDYTKWSGIEYWENEYDYMPDGWNKFYTDPNGANGIGTMVRNGFMYMSDNYENGSSVSSTKATPVTGLSSFKIDLQFSFWDTYSLRDEHDSKDAYCFIKLKTDDYSSEDRMWKKHWFTQAGYGSIYGYGSSSDVISRSPSVSSNNYFQIGTGNEFIDVGESYHYILEYSHGVAHSYIVDVNGDLVVNFGAAYMDPSTTSNIKGIQIGASSGSNGDYYYHNYAIDNIRFYSGDPDDSSSEKDLNTAKDKYLFAYFTGNSDQGEQLRYAVSDDGYNWESLNGAWRVTKDIQSALAANSHAYSIYPTGTAEGTAATGNVRDPYILEAEDGSYYILATDLDTDTNGFSNNAKFLVWHVNDPADIDTVDPWLIDITGMMNDYVYKWNSTINRAWAPEAIWDDEKQAYMLFFAAANTSWNNGTKMYYVYTRDFKTFLTEPEFLLPHVSADYIDGNITYYNGLYYLWYKDETNSKIGYATAEHANGPYTQINEFTPGEYSNVFEGPEIYRLNSNGEYILIADHFSSSKSFIAAYNQTKPFDYNDGVYRQLWPNTSFNINHLHPRHASVCRITTAQYNNLIAKYGRNVWDVSNVPGGKKTKDYLVARYFTTDDPKFDASGHKYKLDYADAVMDTYNGRYAANFDGSTNGNVGRYAKINTDTMVSQQHINAKDGITFDWWGYAQCDLSSVDDNNGRFFDWSSASTPKTVVWDGSDQTQVNNSFIYCAQNMEFGTNNGYTTWYDRTVVSAFKQKDQNAWHRYTMSISEGWITFWKDGTLLKYTYDSDGGYTDNSGTPCQGDQINQALIDKLHNLYFSYSSFRDDHEMWGAISDFRIYNRALTFDDVEDADDQLDDAQGSTFTNDDILMYDPAENMAADGEYNYDGIAKHVYTESVDDEVYGKVLNIAGGVTAHNGSVENASYVDATSTDPDDGYTISFWYNPKTIESGTQTIFNIGNDGTPSGTRKYFEVLENGDAHFTWDISSSGDNYIDLTGLFGTGLTANDWQHITIQIVPNGKYDLIKTYVDGTLKSTKNYATSSNKVEGKSIRHYFSDATRNVYYGNSCGYWADSASGNLDEFKIYSGVIDPDDILTQDNERIADALIEKGIALYEDKMEDLEGADHVYTNMYPAYLAYDEVCRYRDACNIGTIEKNAAKIVLLYNELKTAVNNMHDYKKPVTVSQLTSTNTGLSTINTTSGKIPVNNMLNNQFNLTTANEPYDDYNTKTNSTAAVASAAVVWLYTGFENDTPTAPVACYVTKGNQNGNKGAHTIYMITQNAYNNADKNKDTERADRLDASTDIQLVDYWRMTKDVSSNPGEFAYFNYPDSGYNWLGYLATQENHADGDNSYDYSFYPDKNERNPGGNFIKFIGDSSYFSSTNYLYETNQYFGINLRGANGTVITYNRSTNTAVAGSSVKVIDYSQAYAAMVDTDRTDILSNITSYNPAACKAFVQAYDNLTGIDYVGTINNSVGNASTLATNVKNAVDALTGIDISDEAIMTWAKANDSALQAVVSETSQYTKLYDALKENNEAVLDNEGTSENPVYVPVSSGAHYTTSSSTAYERAYEAIKEYYTNLDPAVEGIDDGAAASRNQNYATNYAMVHGLRAQVIGASTMLVEAADYTPINNVASIETEYTSARLTNNYDDENQQIYTYDTFVDYAGKYEAAKAIYNKSAEYKADIPKYAVTWTATKTTDNETLDHGPYLSYDANGNLTSTVANIDHYVYHDGDYYSRSGTEGSYTYTVTPFEDGNYILVNGEYVDITGKRWYPNAVDTSTESAHQTDIRTKAATAITAYGALTDVDNAAKYQTYDAAYAVANSENRDAYNSAGIAQLESASGLGTQGSVYKILSSAEATAYNNYTNKSYAVGDKIKNSANVDAQTNTLLTTVNTINTNKSTYYNVMHGSLTVKKDGVTGATTTTTAYYGDDFTFTLPNGVYDSTADSVTYSITKYKTYSDGAMSNASGSGKIQNNSNTFTQLANCHMAVTAKITSGTSEGNKIVKIMNIYNKPVGVYYVSEEPTLSSDGKTLTINSETVDPDPVPFYNFDRWKKVGAAEYGADYVYRAMYTGKASYTITASGGTITGNTLGNNVYEYDTKLTLSSDNVANFYGWAAKKGAKYQIVSYRDDYQFFAYADESFVPMTYDSTTQTYSVIDGGDTVELTPSNIDSFTKLDGTESEEVKEAIIKSKLKNKAPFISIAGYEIIENYNSTGKTRFTAAMRFTDGSSAYDSASLVFTKNVADSNFYSGVTGVATVNVSNVKSTKQFTVSGNATFSSGQARIRGLETYSTKYTAPDETDKMVSFTDYTDSTTLTWS